MVKSLMNRGLAAAFGLFLSAGVAHAQSAEDMAKALANPISSLISVPFQLNWDDDIGPVEGGRRFTMNVQPVAPFSIGDDWNLISRTILPIIDQSDIFPGAGSQTGLGDTLQSLFFSPKAPTDSGWIWGVGPVFLLPTGTDDLLTADKWGAGPTGVALKQQGPWTIGLLANHIWSFAGDDDRDDLSNTFVQPFMTRTWPGGWSLSMTADSTYDWKNEQWTVPIGVFGNKVTRIGSQMVQFGVGPRYYADSPDSGPHGWGIRAVFVLLFPK